MQPILSCSLILRFPPWNLSSCSAFLLSPLPRGWSLPVSLQVRSGCGGLSIFARGLAFRFRWLARRNWGFRDCASCSLPKDYHFLGCSKKKKIIFIPRVFLFYLGELRAVSGYNFWSDALQLFCYYFACTFFSWCLMLRQKSNLFFRVGCS